MTADQHISAAEKWLERAEQVPVTALTTAGAAMAQAHALVARALQAERDWYASISTEVAPEPEVNPRWGV